MLFLMQARTTGAWEAGSSCSQKFFLSPTQKTIFSQAKCVNC